MHDIGCSGLVHWDDVEGWYGEGVGRGFQDGEHVYACGGFMLMCGRTNQMRSDQVSRSVVSDSSDPTDCSLPGSSVHGIF